MSDEREALFEHIACTVCGKPTGMTGADCHGLLGRRNPLCREHDGCRIDEKTGEQLAYVRACSDRNVFLRACPGSGKTEAVGLKAAYEMRLWRRPCGGLAVLTFTNAAAKTIQDRIRQFTGEAVGYPHYVATLDSWLHRYIANPFGHLVTGYEGEREGRRGDRSLKVADHRAEGEWLDFFCTTTRYRRDNANADVRGVRVPANRILPLLDGAGFEFQPFLRKGANWLSDQERHQAGAFQKSYKNLTCPTLQELRDDFRRTKDRFWRSGFVTHGDVAHICHRLLTGTPKLALRLARRFPLIIIDECQDLSPTQLSILNTLLENGANVQLVGDLCQAIYEFRQAEPEKVAQFAQTHQFEPASLSRNFRSYQSIVNVCGSLPVDVCAVEGIESPNDGSPVCVCRGYAKGEESSLAEWFVRYLHERGTAPEASAIVTRGRAMVARLQGYSTSASSARERLALAIHLWSTSERRVCAQSLEAIGRCIAGSFFGGYALDTRAHSFSCPRDEFRPGNWRCVLAAILDDLCAVQALTDLQRDWKSWVNEANRVLPEVVNERCGPGLNWTPLPVPRDKRGDSVLTGLGTGRLAPPIRITTIHDVKGETLDAALVVSAAKRGEGGHWKEWLDPARNSEHARFAYVASSRPRYVLVWAVPTPSSDDVRRLRTLGFSFLDEAVGDVTAQPGESLKLDFGDIC